MSPKTDTSEKDLPAGTVTFLFTDIEGSTKLLCQLGERYVALQADHHRLLREIFARWNGSEVDTEADTFFVSFSRATNAVSAAVEAQRALAAYSWPQDVAIGVRTGLHTGEPWMAGENYVGMDVHRAARIARVSHGGQVLLSETRAALLRANLPGDVELLDLGHHRLTDMVHPEHLHQLMIEGLPSEFPPLKTLGLVVPPQPPSLGSPEHSAFLKDGEPATDRPLFVGREGQVSWLLDPLIGLVDGQPTAMQSLSPGQPVWARHLYCKPLPTGPPKRYLVSCPPGNSANTRRLLTRSVTG